MQKMNLGKVLINVAYRYNETVGKPQTTGNSFLFCFVGAVEGIIS